MCQLLQINWEHDASEHTWLISLLLSFSESIDHVVGDHERDLVNKASIIPNLSDQWSIDDRFVTSAKHKKPFQAIVTRTLNV